MPLKRYGVLKGRPIDRRMAIANSSHYQIHVIDEKVDYRVAINVSSNVYPAELEYALDHHFEHPIIDRLPRLSLGFKQLEPRPDSLALDIIRGNLLQPGQMVPIPSNLPGPDNDLNEKIDYYIQRAMADELAVLYAFGELWGPEPTIRDPIFGFEPHCGIHNIHMNQGNHVFHKEDDGIWQDGGVLLHFPEQEEWVALFLKFQSQCWHTDDRTGHCQTTKPTLKKQTSHPAIATSPIKIVAALVNPLGDDRGKETVTLLNLSPETIDLTNWAIANQFKQKQSLHGAIAPGEARTIHLKPEVRLDNEGGIITLLDNDGRKIHGVTYSYRQAHRAGWTIKF